MAQNLSDPLRGNLAGSTRTGRVVRQAFATTEQPHSYLQTIPPLRFGEESKK